jgi:hypothetical protein
MMSSIIQFSIRSHKTSIADICWDNCDSKYFIHHFVEWSHHFMINHQWPTNNNRWRMINDEWWISTMFGWDSTIVWKNLSFLTLCKTCQNRWKYSTILSHKIGKMNSALNWMIGYFISCKYPWEIQKSLPGRVDCDLSRPNRWVIQKVYRSQFCDSIQNGREQQWDMDRVKMSFQ